MLGNDQSPGGGHCAATSAGTARARQGRSSPSAVFSTSLSAYATTVPHATSANAATVAADRLRARHQHTAQSAPSTSSPTSVASFGSPAGSASERCRYPAADQPVAAPSPGGASAVTAAAPEASRAAARTGRRRGGRRWEPGSAVR
ncbi:hypothetical protein [Kitasatospora griseola]|uniref:hypothetical protein n=1 Tax=Kitasatospora griseola TaxID=2064 RepID=UPI0038002F17